jgi:hypothetical protein
MTNKRQRVLILLALSILVIFLGRHFFWPKNAINTSTIESAKETRSSNIGPRVKKTAEEQSASERLAVDERVRAREVEKGKDEWRTPIHFYGKVVDENENPVEGADVELGWNNLNGSPSKMTKSDEVGNFSLENEQGKVLVVSVRKVGYYSSKRDRTSFFYAGENENFSPDPGNRFSFIFVKCGVLRRCTCFVAATMYLAKEGNFVYLRTGQGSV